VPSIQACAFAGSFAEFLQLYRNDLAGLGERLDVTLSERDEIFFDLKVNFLRMPGRSRI